jgi:putative addiction module component (TIGR02574 family)
MSAAESPAAFFREDAMEKLSIPDPPGFSELSKAEKIEYLQALWDRILDEPGEIPVPESHLELAEKRLESYRANPERARSAYEIINILKNKKK